MSGTCTYCDNDTVVAGCQGVAMWCSVKCSEGLLGHCYVVARVLCVVARCLHVISGISENYMSDCLEK